MSLFVFEHDILKCCIIIWTRIPKTEIAAEEQYHHELTIMNEDHVKKFWGIFKRYTINKHKGPVYDALLNLSNCSATTNESHDLSALNVCPDQKNTKQFHTIKCLWHFWLMQLKKTLLLEPVTFENINAMSRHWKIMPLYLIKLALIRWCPRTYMDRQPGLGGPGPGFYSVFNFWYS